MYLNNIYLDFEICIFITIFVKYACMVLRETGCNENFVGFWKNIGNLYFSYLYRCDFDRKVKIFITHAFHRQF